MPVSFEPFSAWLQDLGPVLEPPTQDPGRLACKKNLASVTESISAVFLPGSVLPSLPLHRTEDEDSETQGRSDRRRRPKLFRRAEDCANPKDISQIDPPLASKSDMSIGIRKGPGCRGLARNRASKATTLSVRREKSHANALTNLPPPLPLRG